SGALVEHDANSSSTIDSGSHPAGVSFSRDGKTLFVANWAGNTLSVVDVASHKERGEIPVGKHPQALLPSRDGKRLYVTETDDDSLGVVDVARERRIADVNVGPFDGKFFGASPSAMALSPNGKRLYITLAAVNAVAVLALREPAPRVIGMLPTGWYPTALAVGSDGTSLDVVDGMGEGGRANPQFRPFGPRAHGAAGDASGYIASSMVGSVRRIAIPADAVLAHGTATILANAPSTLRTPLDTQQRGVASPSASIVRAGGPLRHVIYVIKENRTYDQVLGDLAGANGDPALTLFGEGVTPNDHALARRFGILDDTFADAEVSADGHNWSTAAFANDYLEHMWPQEYGGRRILYDFEDGAIASNPHSGYIWNDAAAHGITLRNYGEFVSDPEPDGRVLSHMRDLAGETDPRARGFDLTYSDLDREAEWSREFDAYDAHGDLPQLELLRLPNDHTSGTRPGALTPLAYAAQNDLALGRLIEHLSHSHHWRDTAVFVVEDDAQNGPDHVDAQRMTAYVISAYSRGGVVHAHHSTAGFLRTIELLLGLPPMSAYDAAALPFYDAFTTTPDLRPYDALPQRTDLNARNTRAAYRARDSAHLDFSHEDAVPDATLNDILWHAVRKRALACIVVEFGSLVPRGKMFLQAAALLSLAACAGTQHADASRERFTFTPKAQEKSVGRGVEFHRSVYRRRADERLGGCSSFCSRGRSSASGQPSWEHQCLWPRHDMPPLFSPWEDPR
ncbi:MAG: hypothetical protein M3R44_07285, partial [Candidatus Eremiobacteraeota bacterium]|nr:hypothetical protein [Candidatus Eremiobacteraeota bacterium]